MATFESGDFGRPRGLSIADAARFPKIFGNNSLAGRASATMAAVHSGFVRRVFFLGFDGFFISTHLAFVGFSQTDHPGLAVARREYNAMQPIFDETKHAITMGSGDRSGKRSAAVAPLQSAVGRCLMAL